MAKTIAQSRTNRSAVGGLLAGVVVNVIAARVPLLAPFKDELTLLVLSVGAAAVVAFRQAANTPKPVDKQDVDTPMG